MKVCNELIEAECNNQRSLRVDMKASKPSKLASESATTTSVCHQVTKHVCSHKTTSLSLLFIQPACSPCCNVKTAAHYNVLQQMTPCLHGPKIIGIPPQEP